MFNAGLLGMGDPRRRMQMGLLGQDFSAGQGVAGSPMGFGYKPGGGQPPPGVGIGGRSPVGGQETIKNFVGPVGNGPIVPPGNPPTGVPIGTAPNSPPGNPGGGGGGGGVGPSYGQGGMYGPKPGGPMQTGQYDWGIDVSGNWIPLFDSAAKEWIVSQLYGSGNNLDPSQMDMNNQIGWIQQQTGNTYSPGNVPPGSGYGYGFGGG